MSQRYDRPQASVRASRVWQLFGSVFAVHLVIALVVGVVAWDDGYITLAFARTFAETGHIGLTPYSETVEGATSPLWFLLMAGIYKLGITTFYGFHLASQVVAAVCAGATAVLLYKLIQPYAPAVAWWISFLALLLGPFRTETANGMEMTLLCVVVLGMMNLIRDDDRQPVWGLVVLTALVPLIRLEAAGFVIAGGLAIAVFSRQVRVGLAIIASSLVSIVAISVLRYLVFGTLGLTNTMIAKQLSPYSPPFGTFAWNLQLLVSIVIEPVVTILPAVIVVFVLSRLSGVKVFDSVRQLAHFVKSRSMPARISFAIAYFVAFLVFIIVFGSNYFAPPGRMSSPGILALIAAAVMLVPLAQESVRMTKAAWVATVALFLAPFIGLFSQDLAWMYISRLNSDPKLAFNSTVAYRDNGEAMEHVRELLGQPSLSVLLADVGAPSLCCERLEVLDLGLLANTELSKSGWDGFTDYLRQQKPDLIQTHGVWSQESGIYENPEFTRNYTPVVVGDSLFYMRNDLYDRLKDRCVEASTSDLYFYAGMEPASSKKDAKDATTIDKDYLTSLGLASFCRLR